MSNDALERIVRFIDSDKKLKSEGYQVIRAIAQGALDAAPAPEPEPDVAALESLVDEMGSKLRSLKNSIAWAFMNKDCRDWLDRYESYRTKEAQR